MCVAAVWRRQWLYKRRNITRDAVKDLVLKLSNRGLAKNTVRLAIASLRVVLSSAVEDTIIPANPAIRLGQFVKAEKPEQKAKAMAPEEVEQFLCAAREHCTEYFPLFLIALRAGLRQGEILGLKHGDFHFGEGGDDPDRYIFVQRRWYRGEFNTPKKKEGKTCGYASGTEANALRALRKPQGQGC